MTKNIIIPYNSLSNVEQFQNDKIDHILIKRNAGIDLIIHGCQDDTVVFNGNLLRFSELEQPIRQELDLQNDVFIIVLVYCCFSMSKEPFFGNNMWIIPACNNIAELYYKFYYINLQLRCNFSY